MFPQRVLVAMSALRDQFTSLVQQEVLAAFQNEVFLTQAKDALSCDGLHGLHFFLIFHVIFGFIFGLFPIFLRKKLRFVSVLHISEQRFVI